MENKENTQPKFTPGPWRRSAFEDDWAIRGAKCDRVIARPNCNFDDASANAALIAAAPELYANEEANLEVLKILVVVYQEIENLVATDADVQNVLGPQVTTDVVHGIVFRLRQRIEATEKILAKARGGSDE